MLTLTIINDIIIYIKFRQTQMISARTFNILLRKLNSDPRARELFFNEYYSIIKAHAYWQFGKYNDWEDIAHDVVSKILETDWSSYSYVQFPASWLCAVVDNHAKDTFKRSNRIVSVAEFFIEDFNIDDTIMSLRVRNELKKFSKDIQYIIYAHFWEGYTYQEISRKLGISAVNVRVKAFRALKILKLKL